MNTPVAVTVVVAPVMVVAVTLHQVSLRRLPSFRTTAPGKYYATTYE